jgi:tRNA(fMet)-specific endonuclease VapC
LILLTHLLDTDICIYALKSRAPKLAARLHQLQGKVAISDVSLFELYAGVGNYTMPEQRLELIESFVAHIAVLPFDTSIARVAGPIKNQLKSQGQMIGAYDILIAAAALAHGLTLMTNNTREFNRVPGLQLETFQRQP